MEVVRLGNAHPRCRQTVQGIHFGILPGFFLSFAPVAGAFFHGTGTAAVFDFAAFGVIRALAEAAFAGFLVDLGTAYLVAATHHIDRGFLAAHQLADDLIHQAVFDERSDSFRGFH